MLVVRKERQEYRLGGAANTAANLCALGAAVRVIGALDTDEPAAQLRAMLDDVGADLDQLPLMQHALLRTWRKRSRDTVDSQTVLRLDHYRDSGGLDRALSMHADEVYKQLSGDEDRRVAELMYRCLSARDEDGFLRRRLAAVAEIAQVAEVGHDAVIRVAGAFLRSGRSFLITNRITQAVMTTMANPPITTLLKLDHGVP